MKTHKYFSLLALASSLSQENFNELPDSLKEAEKERLSIKKKNAENKKKASQGIKEYKYGDNIILARNKKNADRKARNKGYLKE